MTLEGNLVNAHTIILKAALILYCIYTLSNETS